MATEGFSAQEREAMKQRGAELKKEASRGRGKKAAADEADLLEKIEQMAEPDRSLAERIHQLVTGNAPELSPKLWYGQPAYASKGTVVCFFRSGQDDKDRYSTFGFTPDANLDEGGFWPTSYAVAELDDKAEEAIAALVKKAVG
ncbi:DUF1801 domain-containing protein [Hoyosella sp. G463]|uniref:DUF1801 domain-containing protein n=1 Tax=Lolliginicoccus lacisalsi TaxID=2742202 RepID=A0A927JCI7_9ACTN|nr:DUF1801 domain-containing protein [Lolliginicoccus lacisalsi]MBD8506117.1 DUF1801 domain-containing protein [Lolliginicoccus lacisalsi]